MLNISIFCAWDAWLGARDKRTFETKQKTSKVLIERVQVTVDLVEGCEVVSEGVYSVGYLVEQRLEMRQRVAG